MNILKLTIAIFLLFFIKVSAEEPDTVTFAFTPDAKVFYTADVRIALVTSSTVTGINHAIDGYIRWVEKGSRPEIQAELKIDAAKFDSDNRTRDNDVRDILNVDEYPYITFELRTIVGLDETPLSELKGDYVATGYLTVHGTKKEISVPVKIEYTDGRLTVEGSTATKYTDFGIDPPRVAGFVGRAPDELRLHVKLIAKVNNEELQ